MRREAGAPRRDRVAQNASNTSRPTSNACGPMAGPSHATTSRGGTRIARKRRLEDAGGEPAPARVRDADDGARAIGEQHRQAIGGAHAEHDARRARHRGVRRGRRRQQRCAVRRVDGDDIACRAPASATPARTAGTARRRAGSRGRRRVRHPAAACAAPMSSVARAPTRHAAVARRRQRAHVRRRVPRRNDPVEPGLRDALRERAGHRGTPRAARSPARRNRRAAPLPMHRRARRRMHESQPLRMQRLARETRAPRAAACAAAARRPR